ncbi:hypothetical protein ACQZ45_25590 [Agrobacterium sp. 16-2014-1-2a]
MKFIALTFLIPSIAFGAGTAEIEMGAECIAFFSIMGNRAISKGNFDDSAKLTLIGADVSNYIFAEGEKVGITKEAIQIKIKNAYEFQSKLYKENAFGKVYEYYAPICSSMTDRI